LRPLKAFVTLHETEFKERVMRSRRIPPPLKWHGGKYYLAPQIVGLMPPHTHYVEPFAGGLSVLLAKDPRGVSEVVNDRNGRLTTLWRVLQDDEMFRQFRRRVEAVPFSEAEWNKAAEGDPEDPVVRAITFFIRCRQSLAGRMGCFAPLSHTRTRRGMNEQASAWISAVDGLPAIHARLRRIAILNRDALDVIRQQDSPQTLFYLDPPYLGQTRTVENVYAFEMSSDQHAELLRVVRSCNGRVMLSGYPSPMYDDELKDWRRNEFVLPNQAAAGKQKRRMTEIVSCNF
jgi:DNA adenine methylase